MTTIRETGPIRRLTAAVGPAAVVVVVLLLLWEIVVRVNDVDPTILPAPSRILEQGWVHRDELWDNTIPTLRATVLGFALATVVALLLATAMDFSPLVRRSLYPLLVVSQTLPLIAIAPLFIIWFGFDLLPKVLIVALVTFFPLTVSTLTGFAASDPELTRLLRSMGASPSARFRLLRVPTAAPYFFSGLRIAITYAVVAAIFAEYAGAERGLGIYMALQKNSARTDLVLAAVAVSAALSVALFALTFLVERATIPWYRLSRNDIRGNDWVRA